MRFVLPLVLAFGCAGVAAAATPYNGFAPVVTKERCFVVLPVAGMTLTKDIGWDQPCTVGAIAEGTGTLTVLITGDLISESTGTLSGGYLDGSWSVKSAMLKSDGSRRGLGTTDLTMKMGCAIKKDGALANPDCVPGRPLPAPAETIAIRDTDSFAHAVWRNQKAAGMPDGSLGSDDPIAAYEAAFCLELGAAAEGPRGQPGGRMLINTCAVKVAAAWCAKGGTKGCETGDGHAMPIPARTGVILPADESGEIVHFACSGTSVRPIVTEAGAGGFYCD